MSIASLTNIPNDSCVIIADYEKYGRTSNQFTYVSDAHSTTSWLDHIICSFDFYSIISDLFILDKLPSSDHLPLCCTCRFELDLELSDSSGVGVIVPSTNYQWCKASDAEIDNYRLRSEILLSEINIPDVVRCYNTACVCNEHKVQLDDYYSSICEALRKASIKSIPTSIFTCSSDYIVAYQVFMNMLENHMTLLEVLISFGDSLVNHVVMSQRVICGQAD